MKNKFSTITLALIGAFSLVNCSRFDEINTSQTAVDNAKVQPEYF